MGERILLGRGLGRFLFALAREVAGDDLERAGRLLADLWREGALKSEGDYRVLSLDVAAERVRHWLPEADDAKLVAESFTACRAQWPILAAWDLADVALPVPERIVASEAWFRALETDGLVKRNPSGFMLLPRLRLLLWLARDDAGSLPTPPPAALRLWSAGLRELRRQGRWQDAGRLSGALLQKLSGARRNTPGWLATAAIGLVQMQDYPRAQELLAGSVGNGSAARLPRRWQDRLAALHSFVHAELGDLRRARELARRSAARTRGTTERIWPALAEAWCNILAGRYRRAERMLSFLERRVTKPEWLRSIITAWQAAANFYLERFDLSRAQYGYALEAAARAGWRDRLYAMLRNSAMNDIDMGEFERARPVLWGLRRRHEKLGYHQLLPNNWAEIGRLYARTERPELGVRASRRAIHLGLAFRAWVQVVHSHMAMGVTARATGEWTQAAHHFAEARALATRAGSLALAGSADLQLSRAEHYAGNTPQALELLDSAADSFARTGQDSRLADAHRQAAEFLMEAGELELAQQRLDLAERLYAGRAWVREAAWARLLRLELTLRRAPHELTEPEIEAIDLGRTVTRWQTTHATGMVALGFALFDDWRSARKYARDTVASSRVTADLYLNRRLYNLAAGLTGETPAMSRLADYWEASMRLPEPGKGVL